MENLSFVSILAERAGTMAVVTQRPFQKALASSGAGENSKVSSKTTPVGSVAEFSQLCNTSALRRNMGSDVAGVVVFWNESDVKCVTSDGQELSTRQMIDAPGFVTIMTVFKDKERQAVSGLRDMAATAPVRKVIVNAIRTLRANTDAAEKAVNTGDYAKLQTLCTALRDTVSMIEGKSKELIA